MKVYPVVEVKDKLLDWPREVPLPQKGDIIAIDCDPLLQRMVKGKVVRRVYRITNTVTEIKIIITNKFIIDSE